MRAQPKANLSRACSARESRRRSCLQVAHHRLPDLLEYFVARNVVALVSGWRVPFAIGAAMAFDHNAVETKKYSTVRFARIHLVTQRAEGLARKQIAEACCPCAIHCRAQIRCELMRRPLRGLQRNVACKPFSDHDVHRTLADIVALDEAMVVEMRELALAQNAPSFAHLLQSFDFLDTDIQQTNGRPLDVEQYPRHRAAHGGKIDEMRFIGADRSAD